MSKRSKVLTKIEIIIILFSISFISLSLLFLLISLIKDIPIISLLVKDYIKEGKSLFLQFIPTYDLFIYLPESLPHIRYTIGHLLDTMIIIHLYFYFETTVYHYIKSAYIKDDLIYFKTPVIEDTDFITVFNEPYKEKQEIPQFLRESQKKRGCFLDITDDREHSNQIRGNILFQIDEEEIFNNYILLFQNKKFYLISKPDFFIALFSIISLKYPYPFSLSDHSSLCSNELGSFL